MKIKEGIDLSVLEKYGFEKSKENPYIDDGDPQYYSEYMTNLGHSRRGQSYYLLVNEDRSISVYASKPDGEGGSLKLTDILVQLVLDGILLKTNEVFAYSEVPTAIKLTVWDMVKDWQFLKQSEFPVNSVSLDMFTLSNRKVEEAKLIYFTDSAEVKILKCEKRNAKELGIVPFSEFKESDYL